MFCAGVRERLDPADAGLWVCGYVQQYAGFSDTLGYDTDYGGADDWEFGEGEALMGWRKERRERRCCCKKLLISFFTVRMILKTPVAMHMQPSPFLLFSLLGIKRLQMRSCSVQNVRPYTHGLPTSIIPPSYFSTILISSFQPSHTPSYATAPQAKPTP